MKIQIKKQISVLSSIALMGMLFFISGCSHDIEVVKSDAEVENDTGQVETRAEAPWEKVRYDYSYLETGVEEANHYLEAQKLSLEDLKQLHEIGNVVFGDYLKNLVNDFENRTPDIMDDTLFFAEEVKKMMYGLLISDFIPSGQAQSIVSEAPHIRINTKHIGKRGDYFFIPIQVYEKDVEAPSPDMPENMIYYVLQVKRSDNKYGWKIYYSGQAVKYAIRGYEEEPWTVKHYDDDFSPEGLKLMVPEDYYWGYYIGERDRFGNGIPYQVRTEMKTRSSGHYDREAAAKYSYKYAKNYNPNYYSWESSGVDCVNFASQCLDAGGLPQNNTWKYYYNIHDPYSSGTPSWRGATNLYDYLLTSGIGDVTPAIHMANIYENGDTNPDLWCDLRWGDLIFMNWQEDDPLTDVTGKVVMKKIRHVMIITHSYNDVVNINYYNGRPHYKLSGHTTNVRDKALGKIAKMGYWRKHAIGVKIMYGLA